MISFIFTALKPELLKKFMLVGNGPYEEKYVANYENSVSRLGKNILKNFTSLLNL